MFTVLSCWHWKRHQITGPTGLPKSYLSNQRAFLQSSSLQRGHFALFLHMCQGESKTNRVMKVASYRIHCGLSKLFSLNWRPINTPLLACMTHRLQQEISRPELMLRGHFFLLLMRVKGTPVMLYHTERVAGSRGSCDCVEHLFYPIYAVQVSLPSLLLVVIQGDVTQSHLLCHQPCHSKLLVGSSHQALRHHAVVSVSDRVTIT